MPEFKKIINGKPYVFDADREPSDAEAMEWLSANTPPAPPEKSLKGFGENLLNSGGRAIKDTFEGLKTVGGLGTRMLRSAGGDVPETLKLVEEMKALWNKKGEIGSAIKDGAKSRYGSLDAVKNTAYNDPIGMALDASTVFGGAGLAAKAGGANKIAKIATKVGDAVDPFMLAGKATGAGLKEVGLDTVLAAAWPKRELREDFGGARKIGKTIINEGLTSHASAKGPLDKGRQAVDDLLAKVDAARKSVKGYLPPARQHVPLGPTPTPSGGRTVMHEADRSVNLRHEPEVPGPSRQNLDALVDTRQDLGGAAPALPTRRLGFDEESIRLAESVGQQSRLAPTGPLLGEGRPARTVADIQYHGTPDGDGIGDTLGGPGVIIKDNPNLGAPGRVLRGHERGVHIDDLIAAIMGDPNTKASRRAALGEPDLRPALRERIAALKEAYPAGDIPLPEANALKREAQELAYESGKDNLSVQKSAQQATAKGLRRGIEDKVPEVGPMNAKEQDLLGASRALKEAEDRQLPYAHLLSLMAGGTLGLTAHPLQGLALAGLGMGASSPTVGTRLGIGLDRVGKVAGAKPTAKTALIMRLAGANKK